MDETDIRIVRKMQENSRISFKTLAKELGLSVDTVIKRFNRLEKSGKIRTTITLSTRKLGIRAIDFYFISLKSGSNISSVIEKLSKIKGVTGIHSASGSYDILIESGSISYSKARVTERKILDIPEVYRLITRIYEIPVDSPTPLSRPWIKSVFMLPDQKFSLFYPDDPYTGKMRKK
jgi:DNA-binding Lrp family transcriptional regulator